MVFNEKIIVIDKDNIQYGTMKNTLKNGSEEKFELPKKIIDYLNQDPELLALLEKTPEDLDSTERKMLRALDQHTVNILKDHSILYIFANTLLSIPKIVSDKKVVLLEENGKLSGWAEYYISEINNMKIANSVKITSLYPGSNSIGVKKDFVNLLYNLTQKYDVVTWEASPSSTDVLPIYNKIVNICKGKTENLKERPDDLKILNNNHYAYYIVSTDAVKYNLWKKLPHNYLEIVEGL